MAYYGMYKCRLCGEKYMRVSVPDSDTVVKHFVGLTTQMKAHQQIDIIDMHCCKNGNFGLSYFQGFEKEIINL